MNTCGPVEGVPAESMTFVPTYDGKGCFIAITLPNLKQAYKNRIARYSMLGFI